MDKLETCIVKDKAGNDVIINVEDKHLYANWNKTKKAKAEPKKAKKSK